MKRSPHGSLRGQVLNHILFQLPVQCGLADSQHLGRAQPVASGAFQGLDNGVALQLFEIGKGVAVHSINCPNVTNLLYEPDRRIDVLWAGDKDGQPVSYPVKITLLCDDRFGMLKQITAVISDTHTNIRNIEARSQNGQASVDVVLEIADMKHLQKIMDGVRQIPGVHDVQRLQKI